MVCFLSNHLVLGIGWEEVSRGSLESSLPGSASVIAWGCFHVGPTSEGSGQWCHIRCNGEREPRVPGEAQAGAASTHSGTLPGLCHSSCEKAVLTM